MLDPLQLQRHYVVALPCIWRALGEKHEAKWETEEYWAVMRL